MLRATYKPVAHILFALVVLSPSPTGRCEGRCDFGPFKTLKKPALEPEVLDAFGPVALSYELDSLLPRHGNTQVLGGHAAIVVNGLGSSQQTFPLREWAATRNGSVIWDRGEIGADYLEWPLELPGALMQAVRHCCYFHVGDSRPHCMDGCRWASGCMGRKDLRAVCSPSELTAPVSASMHMALACSCSCTADRSFGRSHRPAQTYRPNYDLPTLLPMAHSCSQP